MRSVAWQTARPQRDYDVLAPDGSEIRLLLEVGRASMVHCALPPGEVSQPVRHRTVDEVWYCIAGAAQLWRQGSVTHDEEIVDLVPGVAVSIPLGTAFQFRATGDTALEVVITTIPAWPGADEAVSVSGHWPATAGQPSGTSAVQNASPSSTP